MQVPPVPCGSRSQCSPALSAAVTAIPGVVFSGAVSGYLRAYATSDNGEAPDNGEARQRVSASRLFSTILSPGHSRLLWEVDTARDYVTVNGVPARGGAMDGPGPIIVDGMLYVNSGYELWGGLPGNVLLAFEVSNP
jgi:polyvinyl alcohol dehydrogenase (cytochrome)